MADERPGCYYCFKTLDSKDKTDRLRSFVRCSHCRVVYHYFCRSQIEKCLYCSSNHSQQIQIPSPAPLQIVTKTNALPVKASALAFSFLGKEVLVPDFVYKQVLPALHEVYKYIVLILQKAIYNYVLPTFHKHILPFFKDVFQKHITPFFKKIIRS